MPQRASVLSKLSRDLDVPDAEHAAFAACVARALPPGGERHRLTPWLRGRVAVEAVRAPALSTSTKRRLVDDTLARARPLEAGGIPHGLLALTAWLAGQGALEVAALARLAKLAEVAGGLFEAITPDELRALSDWLIARPELDERERLWWLWYLPVRCHDAALGEPWARGLLAHPGLSEDFKRRLRAAWGSTLAPAPPPAAWRALDEALAAEVRADDDDEDDDLGLSLGVVGYLMRQALGAVAEVPAWLRAVAADG